MQQKWLYNSDHVILNSIQGVRILFYIEKEDNKKGVLF